MSKIWDDLRKEITEELLKDEEGRAYLKRLRERGAILAEIEIEEEIAIERAREIAKFKKELAKKMFDSEKYSNKEIAEVLKFNYDEISEFAEIKSV